MERSRSAGSKNCSGRERSRSAGSKNRSGQERNRSAGSKNHSGKERSRSETAHVISPPSRQRKLSPNLQQNQKFHRHQNSLKTTTTQNTTKIYQ